MWRRLSYRIGRKCTDNSDLACAQLFASEDVNKSADDAVAAAKAAKMTADATGDAGAIAAADKAVEHAEANQAVQKTAIEQLLKYLKDDTSSDDKFSEFSRNHKGIYLHSGYKDASTYRTVLELVVNYPGEPEEFDWSADQSPDTPVNQPIDCSDNKPRMFILKGW